MQSSHPRCPICEKPLTGKQIIKKTKYCCRNCYYKSREGHDVSEATCEKIRLSKLGKKHPEWRIEINRKCHLGQKLSKDSLVKRGLAIREAYKNPEVIQRKRDAHKGKIFTEKTKQKISEANKREDVLLKRLDSFYGGFWYGNVRYPETKTYCELWNGDLRERIRAAFDYKSAISGITTDERGRKLDCHHIYFQEKACCHWDKDMNGYYAMINIGTKRNPNMIRYDIKGNPNKFVPLTRAEHTATRFDKLHWIKVFEDIIEKRGGKCYLTKEEMVVYQFQQKQPVVQPIAA